MALMSGAPMHAVTLPATQTLTPLCRRHGRGPSLPAVRRSRSLITFCSDQVLRCWGRLVRYLNSFWSSRTCGPTGTLSVSTIAFWFFIDARQARLGATAGDLTPLYFGF